MIVADHVFDVVARRGVRDVFTVSGGGIMYLLDALGTEPRPATTGATTTSRPAPSPPRRMRASPATSGSAW